MTLYNPPFVLGISSATSLAIGGATIGSNALAVTGTVAVSSTLQAGLLTAPNLSFTSNSATIAWGGWGQLQATSDGTFQFANHNAAAGAYFTIPANASWQFGQADIDTGPVAQITRTQGALAGGTSNVAGVDWTRIASPGKGTGAGGKHIWQTALAGSTGTVVNTPTNALILSGQTLNVCANTATPAAGAAGAVLLFGTTAGFGIYYGSGAPTVSAAQGSLYLRSDGSSTSTRLYINTTGSTTWTNVTTAA